MNMAQISNYWTNRGCMYGSHRFGNKTARSDKGLKFIDASFDDLDDFAIPNSSNFQTTSFNFYYKCSSYNSFIFPLSILTLFNS